MTASLPGRPTRSPLVFVIGVLLAGLVVNALVDQKAVPARVASGSVGVTGAMAPVVTPQDAGSSTWYCPGANGRLGDLLEAFVVILNPTPVDALATIHVYAAAAPEDTKLKVPTVPKVVSLAVRANSQSVLRLSSVLQVPYAAALVEADAGGLVVLQRVAGARGSGAVPCASAPSSTWYLPWGATARDASERLLVFNPFAEDAVLDAVFTTSDGFRAPPDLSGFVVPAGRLMVVDVGASVGRHPQVGAALTVRRGRAVVGGLQTYDGTGDGHPSAASATVAAPSTAAVWNFPFGMQTATSDETLYLFNPGTAAADVEIDIALDNPAENGSVDPLSVSVPSQGSLAVPMRGQPRVPDRVGHSFTVRVRNGPPIVAERVLEGRSGTASLAGTIGSPVVAGEWVFGHSGVPRAKVSELVFFNPSPTEIAKVQVSAVVQGVLQPVTGLETIEVAPLDRVVVSVAGRLAPGTSGLVARAAVPFVAEQVQANDQTGLLEVAMGVAGAEGLGVPSSQPPSTTSTTVPEAQSTDGIPTESSSTEGG